MSEGLALNGGRPVYLYEVFQKHSAFAGSSWPFNLTGRVYRLGDCPVAEAAFERWIKMQVYEHYTDTDIDEIGAAIAKVAGWYAEHACSSNIAGAATRF